MKVYFVMSDKSEIQLDKNKAEAVLRSPDNIVMVSDEKGKWTGVTVNKSFLIRTAIDYDALEGVETSPERQLQERQPDREMVKKKLDELRDLLKDKLPDAQKTES